MTPKTPKPSSKRLGRGLSTLLGDNSTVPNGSKAPVSGETELVSNQSVRMIAIEWIEAGPWQPRQIFDQEGLEELARSIALKGIIQPVILRPHPDKKNRFQLIAGERRWRAAQLASIHEIPSIIDGFSDKDASELALIENIQRRDLSVIEEAISYRKLIELHQYRQEELADIIGKSRSHIANLLRLLHLPDAVQQMVMHQSLTMGQVRPLIGREDAEQLAKLIMAKNLSARQVEALVSQNGSAHSAKKPQKAEKTSDIRAIEKQAQIDLGLRINLDWQEDKEKGTLSMSLTSLDQLEDILGKLGIKTA